MHPIYPFLLMTRPPPRSTLFPYTTLFRSERQHEEPMILNRIRRGEQMRAMQGFAQAVLEEYADKHCLGETLQDRKSTRLNSSHSQISYAVFCLKKKI